MSGFYPNGCSASDYEAFAGTGLPCRMIGLTRFNNDDSAEVDPKWEAKRAAGKAMMDKIRERIAKSNVGLEAKK